jgi:hypothetical protein
VGLPAAVARFRPADRSYFSRVRLLAGLWVKASLLWAEGVVFSAL